MSQRHQASKHTRTHPHTAQGFSLLELMIVITIISLLAAWSYPHYIHAVQRTECRRGQLALQQLANRIEHYATLHGNYLGANRNNLQVDALQQQTQYHFEISQLSAHHYTLIGISQQKHASAACHSLSQESGVITPAV